MKEYTLDDLLLTIAYKDEDEKAAKEAFSKLYHKFSPKCLHTISTCFPGINEEIYHDVLSNTFLEIYLNPVKFNFDKNKHENVDDAFSAWLFVVAKNELLDLVKKSNKQKKSLTIVDAPADTECFEPSIDYEKLDSEFISDNMYILEKALETLSEKNRGILRMLYAFHEEGKNTPSDVLDMICSLYSTTKANIRKIKSRSEKKVIEYVEKYSNLKAVK